MKKTILKPNLALFGFTLIEIAIVMAVIGAIVGAIWLAEGTSSDTQKANDAATEIQTVSSNIINIYSGHNFSSYPHDMTSAMITAQAIPPAYVDAAGNGTADHVWSLQNFFVYSQPAAPTLFRLALHKTSYNGCIALLQSATSCEAGQLGCPVEAFTVYGNLTCSPNQNNCPSALGAASFTPPGPAGWLTMTPSVIIAMCSGNVVGGQNSVELNYSL